MKILFEPSLQLKQCREIGTLVPILHHHHHVFTHVLVSVQEAGVLLTSPTNEEMIDSTAW